MRRHCIQRPGALYISLVRTASSKLPPPAPGSSLQTLWRWYREPVAYLERLRDALGPSFTFRWPVTGAMAFFSDAEDLRTIFTAPPSVAKGDAGFLGALMGESSVLIVNDEAHQRKRRALAPALSTERIAAFSPRIRELAREHFVAASRSSRVDLSLVFRRLTLQVILEVVFAADPSPARRELATALETVLDLAGDPVIYAPPLRVDLGPWSPWGRFKRRIASADALIYALIRERREATKGATRDAKAPRDVLTLLLESKDESGVELSDREIRDELVTLLVTGHETTATSASWLFDELSTRRDVVEALRGEAAARDGERRLVGSVVRESLRLHPVFTFVGRKLAAPLKVGDYELDAGWTAVACIALAHSSPKHFDAPRSFVADRFVREKPAPYAWIPFGGGARRCIGMSLAMLELETLVAVAADEFDFAAERAMGATAVRRGMTLSPDGGVWVRVTARRGS